MDLVERYVVEVGRRVPASKRQEVVAELRSAILDALEGRGARDEDDVVAVLREFGDPVRVAADYHPEGQYLIGPGLYPTFVRVLRLVVITALLLNAFAYIAMLLLGSVPAFAAGAHLSAALRGGLESALISAVVVLVVFFFIQRSSTRPGAQRRDWDPRALPAMLDADHAGRIDAAFSLGVAVLIAVIVGAVGQSVARGYRAAPDLFQPIIEHALLASLPILMAALVIEALMWAVVLVDGRWRIWTRVVHALSDALAALAFVNASIALMTDWERLIVGGVREIAVSIAIATLWVIAGSILAGAIVREVRARRRRRQERAEISRRSSSLVLRDADRPTPPTARTARA